MLSLKDIKKANELIKPYLKRTPIITSKALNEMLGHEIYFKCDSLQVTNSFKIRGVMNFIISRLEKNDLPKKIVAYSSGNHAHAVAYTCNKFGIKSEIYMPKSASKTKQSFVLEYGGNLVITETRKEAEVLSYNQGNMDGNFFLHPSDNDLVISGAGTIALETIEDLEVPIDAFFASCGGGGLLSGILITTKELLPNTPVFGCEPEIANDAKRSFYSGDIFSFQESPNTIADGIRTLALSARTFEYIKQCSDMFDTNEVDIINWTKILDKMLDINCEPTCAVAMSCASDWLKKQKDKKKILIYISGGNIDSEVVDLLNLKIKDKVIY